MSVAMRARDKALAGEELTAKEKKALKEVELENLRKHGTAYLQAMPKMDYCGIIGKHQKQMADDRRYGFPWPFEKDARINVCEVLIWFHTWMSKNGRKIISGGIEPNGDEPWLQDASKEIKDKYIQKRIEGVELDNEKKRAELSKTYEQFVPIEPIRQWHNQSAELIRRLRERLSRDFDGDNRERIEQGFDDLIDDLVRLTDEQFGNDGDSSTDKTDMATDDPQ